MSQLMSRIPAYRSALVRKLHDQRSPQDVVIHVPKCNVFRFGDSNKASPVFEDLEWTVNEGESWAVVGSGWGGQKTALLQMLLGHLRIFPPPAGGLFPFLSPPSSGCWRDPSLHISMVSFSHRPRSSGGAFYDYTARYGAVREEDRITLRQDMFPDTAQNAPNAESNFDDLAEKLGLKHLIDLPLVALSNGQTRRARILKALLSRPELLLLDEPLTGLDIDNRSLILSLLHSLHTARSPRIIIGLRAQDPVPDWISHLAVVKDKQLLAGPKDEILALDVVNASKNSYGSELRKAHDHLPQKDNRRVIVELKNVSVSYHERKVLKNIHWTIRDGDRIHLQGANGSGKTTLLSLLTGDHPQSYTQIPPNSQLTLFGRSRSHIPTPQLRSLIGVVSPELYNAFPRRSGMSVWDAVGTGFDGGFVPLGAKGVGIGLAGGLTDEETQWRVDRVWEVSMKLGPHTWRTTGTNKDIGTEKNSVNGRPETFAARSFVDLSTSEQSMVLLMRALVGRPQLVLLDEVWSGMDEAMITAARTYFRAGGVTEDQAVVVISHWEDEVPWGIEDGVKKFRLEGGVGKEV